MENASKNIVEVGAVSGGSDSTLQFSLHFPNVHMGGGFDLGNGFISEYLSYDNDWEPL